MQLKQSLLFAFIALAAVVLSSIVPAKADTLDDFNLALKVGDYPKALELGLPLAEKGNSNVQVQLGYIYRSVTGMPHDQKKAVMWFQHAADQGNVEGIENLANMYFENQGVPPCSERKGAELMKKAAEMGDDFAAYFLGYMYGMDKEVIRPGEIDWYTKVSPECPYTYETILPKDYPKAYMWLNIAMQTKIGYMHQQVSEHLGILKKSLSPQEIEVGEGLLSEWRSNHSKSNGRK